MEQGRTRYLQERFEIYQIEIDNDWIIADDLINYNAFNNIITNSLALGKKEFAISFLEKYQPFLIPEMREDLVLYNRARIAFAKKDFSTCLSLAQQTAYLDTLITLGVKRLQIMCKFEQGDSEQLLDDLNSFNVYLHRMAGSQGVVKTRNKAFVKAAKLLDKAFLKNNEPKFKERLNTLLKAHPLMPEREWLEEKLQDL